MSRGTSSPLVVHLAVRFPTYASALGAGRWAPTRVIRHPTRSPTRADPGPVAGDNPSRQLTHARAASRRGSRMHADMQYRLATSAPPRTHAGILCNVLSGISHGPDCAVSCIPPLRRSLHTRRAGWNETLRILWNENCDTCSCTATHPPKRTPPVKPECDGG